MSLNQTKLWYQFSLQQMAAESYLHLQNSPGLDLRKVLKFGNNYPLVGDNTNPDNPRLAGATRMTDTQVDEFSANFEIIDHSPNDESGLSMTLFRRKTDDPSTGAKAGDYTVSFRSTEFANESQGGDWKRDGSSGADGQVMWSGFAFNQLINAERIFNNWLAGKNADGSAAPVGSGLSNFSQASTQFRQAGGASLYATGYSLGGNLATTFTVLHDDLVRHAYTFNGAGIGKGSKSQISDMLAYFQKVMEDPEKANDVPSWAIPSGQTSVNITGYPAHPETIPPAYSAAKAVADANTPLPTHSNENIYDDARAKWANEATRKAFGILIGSTNFNSESVFGNITSFYGRADHGDYEIVANSGRHGQDQRVFIEDQPDIYGLPLVTKDDYWLKLLNAVGGGILPGDFGTTHSITLIADSLKLQSVLLALTPSAASNAVNGILGFGSNQRASGFIFQHGESEGNSLENVLDGLRRIFVGPSVHKTLYDNQDNGFGNLEKRTAFYANIAELEGNPAFQAAQGKITLTAAAPDAGKARTDFGQFLSLYYLTPFSLTVNDSAVESALVAAQGTVGEDWMRDKALSADDRAAGKAVFSDRYLADRRAMLTYKLEYNRQDKSYTAAHSTPRNYIFTDLSSASVDSEAIVIDTSGQGNELGDRHFYFGSEGNDSAYTGGGLADHLYGMGGNDILKGEGGKDWIEGGNGADELHGGDASDTLFGGTGNDQLFGDDGQDFLYGGADADVLDGGQARDALYGDDGNDKLIGGADNDALYGDADDDSLTGGTGNDWLEGGTGNDVYHFKAGDGNDVIVDADGAGRIEVEDDNGSVLVLAGGQGKPVSGQWSAVVGGHTYSYAFAPDSSGAGNLVIRRDDGTLSISVRGFQNGRLGITLADLPIPAVTPPANAGQATSEYADNQSSFDAKDGNDVVISRAGADTIDGGDGDDYLVSSAGNKLIVGGAGNDMIETGGHFEPNAPISEVQQPQNWAQGWADWQNVDTGGLSQQWTRTFRDLITGQAISQYDQTWRYMYYYKLVSSDSRGWKWVEAPAFADPQTLNGGLGNDTIDASNGDDVISGEDGDDLLFGGENGNDTLYGGKGADKIMANAGDDLILAGDDNDFVDGADGADTLFGGLGADTLLGDGVESGLVNRDDVIDGGDGDDVVDAGGGNDKVFGGTGNDIIFAASIYDPDVLEANLVDGGDGADKIVGSAGADTLIGGAGNDVISGSGGAQATGGDHDVIYGDDGDDLIVADGGNDQVDGGAGNDSLHGDNDLYAESLHGNDTMHGNEGNDSLLGYGGDDSLFGDAGNDTVQGANGNDYLDGGAGIDLIMGGDGNDKLYGGDGSDGFDEHCVANGGALRGGKGNDSLYGGAGLDGLLGEDGNDVLSGEDGDDQLDGGMGDDVLDGGSGSDILIGGIGNDTYVYSAGVDLISDSAGKDTLILSGLSRDSVYIKQAGSQLQIVSEDGTSVAIEGGFTGTIERFKFGGAFVSLEDLLPEVIFTPQSLRKSLYQPLDASQGENLPPASEPDPDDLDLRGFLRLGRESFNLSGTNGNDSLYGGGANDTITGNDGDDFLAGAGGDDQIDGGKGLNIIDGEEGNDRLIGGVGADTLIGGTGSDTLISGSGDDSLIGGSGNDLLQGGYGADRYVFASGFGVDVIDDLVNFSTPKNTISFTDSIDRDTLHLTRVNLDVVIVFGNGDQLTVKNFFVNSTTANFDIQFADGVVWGVEEIKQRSMLVATDDNDTLSGWEINDLIDGKDGNDALSGGDGNDTLFGGKGFDSLAGGNGDDMLVGDPDGYYGNDYITGDAGNDTIIAGDGDDTVAGGDGDDTYIYYAGETADTLVASTDRGNNTIQIEGIVNNLQFVRPYWDRNDLLVGVYDSANRVKYIVLDNLFSLSSMVGTYSVRLQQSGTMLAWGDVLRLMLTGTEENNTLWGTASAESFSGAGGDDDLHGWAGNDTLAGNQGLDTLEGGLGDDVYLIDAGQGRDIITEEGGQDTLYIGNGITPEQMVLQRVGDALYLASQDGSLQVRLSSHFKYTNSIRVGAVENIQFSNGMIWTLEQIDAKAIANSADTMNGSDINDVYVYDNPKDVISEPENSGDDLAKTSIDYDLGPNIEQAEAMGCFDVSIQGNGLSNTIKGNVAANIIRGYDGNDTLFGGAGNDTIYGGDGSDSMYGGVGNDLYYYDDETPFNSGDVDVAIELPNEGNDTIYSYAYNTTLPENIENLSLGYLMYCFLGVGRNATGNGLNNVIDVTAIDDTSVSSSPAVNIDGGAGADTMHGGGRTDTNYIVDNALDVVIESAGGSKDTVITNITYSLGNNIENIKLTGTEAIAATGNELANTLDGSQNNAANVLIGLQGNDTYVIGAGDSVVEAADGGNDTVVVSIENIPDYIARISDYQNIENIKLSCSQYTARAGTLVGDGGNNSLWGGCYNDTIDGGAGDDVIYDGYLSGSSADDLLVGGSGNDSIFSKEGVDTLVGGVGDDTLYGFRQAWSYFDFSRGDGADVIAAESKGFIVFGEGVLFEDINVSRIADDLLINIKGTTDQILVKNQFSLDSNGQHWSRMCMQFSNGVYVEERLLDAIAQNGGTPSVLGDDLAGGVGNDSINGLEGNDVIYGLAGDDTLIGDFGNDTLRGAEGDDWLEGGDGDDYLEGGAGNNYMGGGAGDDWLYGGSSNDTIYTGDGRNYTFAFAGDDLVVGGIGDDVLEGNDGNDTLCGGSGNDHLSGDLGEDIYRFDAGFGQDIVYVGNAWPGDVPGAGDWIEFGFGVSSGSLAFAREIDPYGHINLAITVNGTSDSIYVVDSKSNLLGIRFADNSVLTAYDIDMLFSIKGSSSNDSLSGDATDNQIYGLAGNDTLNGGDGNDTLDGGEGVDKLVGGNGNDLYQVDNIGDTITETTNGGYDVVEASVSFSLASYIEELQLTGATAISATGNTLANILIGNAGANTLNGGTGADTMLGGAGDDVYVVDNANDVVTENAGEGTDLVQASISYSLANSADIENLTLTGSNTISATGNALDNVLIGNSANNTLTSGAGNDRLDGGAGNDTMAGGTGNDTYVVNVSTDVVTENANEGIDTVEASVTYSIASQSNVENLALTGSGTVNATGNAAANVLTGNSGANVLDGGLGADTLIGGVGNDTYVADNAGDVITEAANEGTDLVNASVSVSLANFANVENLTLTGSSALNATGNALANTLTGNSGANVLDGGAGNDTLVGGAGNDTYIVDSLSDVVTEAASAGTDTIQASLTYSIASLTNVENLTLTGTTSINATGNTLANVLTGNSGNNRLDGGSGNDTMIGGAGNDTYVFNVATDVATESANEGIDTIEIGVTLSIASVANVENITLTGTGAINATGNTLDNVLLGNSGNNSLTGGAGNDRLDGGAGNDTMVGGTGNDTYVVNVSTDVVTENANEGSDTVESSLTYSIAALANLEHITLTGGTAINATGNASANILIGNGAVNTLSGGAGNDTLDGGAGNDSLVGGTGNDTYVLGRGYGAETVTENDSTAGNTDVASFMAGIGTDQIWFRKVNTNDLEVSVIGTADKLTLTSWYLGSQYHVEQFKTADGKLLVDADVQKLVNAMAAFAPPAAGQTTLPANYQTTLSPVLAANWH